MKRIISVSLVVLLLISVLGAAALAGGHRGGHAARKQTVRQQTRYEICAVEDCDVIGAHRHGDDWYCGSYCLQGEGGFCCNYNAGRGNGYRAESGCCRV